MTLRASVPCQTSITLIDFHNNDLNFVSDLTVSRLLSILSEYDV